ncbi:hypothetical protein GCK32_004266, partial [Trichostrongylus colubriformis]
MSASFRRTLDTIWPLRYPWKGEQWYAYQDPDARWFTCAWCAGDHRLESSSKSSRDDLRTSDRSSSWTWATFLDWRQVCCLSAWQEVKRSAEMQGICCCAPCKPRYRRLVDSIYPRAITDGLISSNMQKLIFYAISHPEKLERIGEYLVLRMGRDLGRMRLVQVKQLATDSFVTFSNIEESSPSYHRQYDFFISKFSQMCHATYGEDSRKIRSAGLKGLRGVVWKSVTDDLHPNIWEKQHMDKIVP